MTDPRGHILRPAARVLNMWQVEFKNLKFWTLFVGPLALWEYIRRRPHFVCCRLFWLRQLPSPPPSPTSCYWGWDLAEWLERLTANAEVATVLGSIPASSDKVESEGRHMECWREREIKWYASKKAWASSNDRLRIFIMQRHVSIPNVQISNVRILLYPRWLWSVKETIKCLTIFSSVN